ncbi:hypothetical protein EVAR_63148_1 [Eumeta japonica]|uniref:Uncharacterized protein n=1 Tax=Eumeta variegata TaxID=151549 RepID=A0A4C2AA22_EUMVA|nr:hypothetical protein EVAR_63148_1 [Eumeta japonica]
MASGLSAEDNTDHVSLRFIQSNLQRSKLALYQLLIEAERMLSRPKGNPTPRREPNKTAIIVLDSGVDVEEDQTLIDENVIAAGLVLCRCISKGTSPSARTSFVCGMSARNSGWTK